MNLKKLLLKLERLNNDVELLKENLSYYINKEELTENEWAEWRNFRAYLLMRYQEIKVIKKEIEKFRNK